MLKSISTITTILIILRSLPAFSQDTLTVIVGSQHISNESQITLPVKVVHFDTISYFQFSISWDTSLFAFNTVSNFNLGGLEIGLFNITEAAVNSGKFGFTWLDPNAQASTLPDSTRIYDIVLDVIGIDTADSKINFSTDPTDIEAGDVNNIEIPIKTLAGNISYEEQTTSAKGNYNDQKFQVFQNQPNPFRETTKITIELAKSQELTWHVYDLSGRQILNRKSFYPRGVNYIELNKLQLNGPGVYEYTVSSKTKTITKKLILLNQ